MFEFDIYHVCVLSYLFSHLPFPIDDRHFICVCKQVCESVSLVLGVTQPELLPPPDVTVCMS